LGLILTVCIVLAGQTSERVNDAQTDKNSFLMISATGRRAELRQVGSSNVYESGDSSYLRLTDNSPNLLLRSTDGTQLSFVEINEYSCTQVKDRNGNYITVNHNGQGRITAITDTLGRAINFNYDGNANLISITQRWNGQPSHQRVAFSWSTRSMQSSFPSVSVIGPMNGTSLPVLTGVTLNDELNPRITETNVQDSTSQRSQAYLDRRIIGLVAEVHLTNVSQYQGKISYSYDDPTRLQSVPSAATQHDTAYSTSFTARGNLTGRISLGLYRDHECFEETDYLHQLLHDRLTQFDHGSRRAPKHHHLWRFVFR
jgi:YD repeat-containing protein